MSRFLTLPPEIGDVIYLLAVIQPGPIHLIVRHERRCPLEPALAAVSRQTRGESLAIFYRHNTFLISSFDYAVNCLSELDPELVKQLRDVHIVNPGRKKASRRNQLLSVFNQLSTIDRGRFALRKDALAVRIYVKHLLSHEWRQRCQSWTQWNKLVDIEESDVVGRDGASSVWFREREE